MVLTGAAFYHKYWHYLFTAAPSVEGMKEYKTAENKLFKFKAITSRIGIYKGNFFLFQHKR